MRDRKRSPGTGVTTKSVLDRAWSQQNQHAAQIRVGVYTCGDLGISVGMCKVASDEPNHFFFKDIAHRIAP